MSRILRLLLLLLYTASFSCDDNPVLVDCRECTVAEPEYATLLISLDPGFKGGLSTSAVVRVYEGNLEDNILTGTYFVPGRTLEVNVSLNKKYTVTATYSDVRGIVYVAVDTAFPRLNRVESQCDEPCWLVYDRVLRLSVKYTR